MKKVYKISYGNFFKFIFSQILSCFNNIFTFLIVVVSMMWLQQKLESMFSEDNMLLQIITTLMVSSIIALFIMLLIFLFAPKKVTVDSNYVTVKRYMLNFNYLFRGFNDKIFIKDIVDCRIYEGEKYLLHRSGPYTVFFFDWNDLVEIKTGKVGKYRTFLVPVKNSNEFINMVRECTDQSGDGSLC